MAHKLVISNGCSDSDDDTVILRICINKQYLLTDNIDSTQDIWKSGELNVDALNINDLRNEIPFAFRTKTLFKALFSETKQWQWTVYEYKATKACIPIEKSDDLQAYIRESISPFCDREGHEKCLKLRIVFHRRDSVKHDVANTIPCDICAQNIPFKHYKDHQFAHSVDRTSVAPVEITQVYDSICTNNVNDDCKMNTLSEKESSPEIIVFSENKNESNVTHTSNDIPCEECGEYIPFFEYQDHQMLHLLSVHDDVLSKRVASENKVEIDDISDSNYKTPSGATQKEPRWEAADDDDHHKDKDDDCSPIPLEFKDPITNKIMKVPIMIVSSAQVYDEITIKEMIKSQRTYDVITGIPFSIGEWPLLLEYRVDITAKIEVFLKEHPFYKQQVINKSDAKQMKWELLFENHENKMREEVAEIVQDQSSLEHSAKQIFKALNEQKEEKEEQNAPKPSDTKKELLKKVKELYNNLEIKNRRFFFSKHENCFVGSEAVSVIMDLGFANNKDGAVAFGNKLIQHDIIWHVEKKHSFKNDNKWYKFVENMSRIPDDEKIDSCSGVDYDASLLLQPDIAVVCIMGPSRNGKSTIVNDILGVKDACKISSCSNIASTKGAWITKYSRNEPNLQMFKRKNEFYLLDMEGMSHHVTKFTKQLFYACYATANVVIWNDMEIMADRFVKLMKELQKEMKIVASSDHKPAFLYLKRDAGDYDYSPCESLHDYINKDPSFKWFRDMNIFSSLSGYELNRPTRDKNNKKGILNFQSKPENRALLTPLIETIIGLCTDADRFASNASELQTQINHINESTALNMTELLIAGNEILKLFALCSKDEASKRSEMIYVACEFGWNHKKLDDKFAEELTKLKKTLSAAHQVDYKAIEVLETNKNEIYQRIKNKKLIKDGHFAFNVGNLVVYSAAAVTASVATGGIAAAGYGLYVVSLAARSVWLYKYKTIKKGDQRLGGFVTGNYLDYSLGETDQEIKKCS